jgi:hypothetical protein
MEQMVVFLGNFGSQDGRWVNVSRTRKKMVHPLHLLDRPYSCKSDPSGQAHHYSIAISFREDGKNQKKSILALGNLTHNDAEACRAVLKIWNQAASGLIRAEDVANLQAVSIGNRKDFLGVAVMFALWQELGLHKVYPSRSVRQRLGTDQLAYILTACQVLDPGSKTHALEWFKRSCLAQLLELKDDDQDYGLNSIFRGLDIIANCHDKLEAHCQSLSRQEIKKYEHRSIHFPSSLACA